MKPTKSGKPFLPTVSDRSEETEGPTISTSARTSFVGSNNVRSSPTFKKQDKPTTNFADTEMTGANHVTDHHDDDDSTQQSNGGRGKNAIGLMIMFLMIVVGAGASAFFLVLGITSAKLDKRLQFDKSAGELVKEIETAFQDYEVAGLFIQEASRRRTISRQEFREMYLNLISTGLEFQVTSFNPNVTDDQRITIEEESRSFYSSYFPHITYTGIQGLEPKDDGTGVEVKLRSQQPFYFPVHLLEPVEGNVAAIDFDLYSSGSRRKTIHRALRNWKPALTPRLQLVQETDKSAYSVILMHPGIPLPASRAGYTDNIIEFPLDREQELHQDKADSFSSMVIRIPDLLKRASKLGRTADTTAVYVYDTYNHDGGDEEAVEFLGAVTIRVEDVKENGDDGSTSATQPSTAASSSSSYSSSSQPNRKTTLEPRPELSLDELRNEHFNERDSFIKEETIEIVADQRWLIVVVSIDGAHLSDLTFVILAGCLLFCLCLSLGVVVYMNFRRIHKLNKIKARAERERAQLIVENARQAAQSERELNDFIAHEVRNPLAAAMSACSFVASAVEEAKAVAVTPSSLSSSGDNDDPTSGQGDTEDVPLLVNEEQRLSVKEDIGIIDSSLHFINDLLRNMLDMQRASSKQLKINAKPTHVLNDVLRPVDSMLHRRGANFVVELDCQPADLIIMTDSLRLKQVVLNLARNAVKFVEAGFIRIKANVAAPTLYSDSSVQISVEDSGPGIPLEKRKQLFGKFQETLDAMNQGTGIGLSLCKTLTSLMGGKLYIDELYDSGYPGCPGTRFVVDLQILPLDMNDQLLDMYADLGGNSVHSAKPAANATRIPTRTLSRHRSSNLSSSSFHNSDHPPSVSSFASTSNHGGGVDDGQPSTTKNLYSPSRSGEKNNNIKKNSSKKKNNTRTSKSSSSTAPSSSANKPELQLPEKLAVLFVDDDMVLRKLFTRAVKKVAPGWAIHEASNGETALKLTSSPETNNTINNGTTVSNSSNNNKEYGPHFFDVIFMDQYMASVTKQLLGTETTRAMRAQGVTARICGLSANDVEASFQEAGADSFLFKPFPCQPAALRKELIRIVHTTNYIIQRRSSKLYQPQEQYHSQDQRQNKTISKHEDGNSNNMNNSYPPSTNNEPKHFRQIAFTNIEVHKDDVSLLDGEGNHTSFDDDDDDDDDIELLV